MEAGVYKRHLELMLSGLFENVQQRIKQYYSFDGALFIKAGNLIAQISDEGLTTVEFHNVQEATDFVATDLKGAKEVEASQVNSLYFEFLD